MNVTEVKGENEITLQVEGKVDTMTSPQLQEKILLSLQKMSTLIVDFEKVDYISSAGLRALLMGHKTAASKGGKMTIRHVNQVVKDIFKTTGFDKFLIVED